MAKLKELTTAQALFEQRLTNSGTLRFILESFMDYHMENEEDWEEKLSPIMKDFQVFLNNAHPDVVINGASIVSLGLPFLGTMGEFTMSELIGAGATLSVKEMEQFKEEIINMVRIPAKREKLKPYIAAIGCAFMQHMEESTNTEKLIEMYVKRNKKLILATELRDITEQTADPYKHALALIQRLDNYNISVDIDGNIIDPDGNYAKQLELKNKVDEDNKPK